MLTSYEKGTNRFEYSYNEDGLRVEKKYYSNNTLNDICTYVWENGKLIAQKKYSCANNNYLTITYLYDGEVTGEEMKAALIAAHKKVSI